MDTRNTDSASYTTLRWETIEAKTTSGRYRSAIERRVILLADALMAEKGNALDIGCEGGRWAALLQERGWQLICTEVDERSLAICQRRLPQARCVLSTGNETTLPVGSGSVGLALCMAVEPVLFSDWIVGEAVRTLRPGGVLVGYFCNRSSFRGLKYRIVPSARRRAHEPSQYSYCYPLSYAPWKMALYARGFEVVHEEGLSWPPFPNASDSPLIPFAARLERALGLWRLTRFSPHILFVARKCA